MKRFYIFLAIFFLISVSLGKQKITYYSSVGQEISGAEAIPHEGFAEVTDRRWVFSEIGHGSDYYLWKDMTHILYWDGSVEMKPDDIEVYVGLGSWDPKSGQGQLVIKAASEKKIRYIVGYKLDKRVEPLSVMSGYWWLIGEPRYENYEYFFRSSYSIGDDDVIDRVEFSVPSVKYSRLMVWFKLSGSDDISMVEIDLVEMLDWRQTEELAHIQTESAPAQPASVPPVSTQPAIAEPESISIENKVIEPYQLNDVESQIVSGASLTVGGNLHVDRRLSSMARRVAQGASAEIFSGYSEDLEYFIYTIPEGVGIEEFIPAAENDQRFVNFAQANLRGIGYDPATRRLVWVNN